VVLTAWDCIIAQAGETATDELRTALFLEQVQDLPSIGEDISHYNRLPASERNYDYLRKACDNMLKRKLEERVRKGQLDALNGKSVLAVPGARKQPRPPKLKAGLEPVYRSPAGARRLSAVPPPAA
jgi:hypothetical protein